MSQRAGLRITGGELCGRRLRVPGRGVRPTAERVREAVFARLGELEGAVVLDLYAGSGALGIEALSRGASRAVFIERAPSSLAALRSNLTELGLTERAQVIASDVSTGIRRLDRVTRFDCVLLDPPYASGELPRALAALRRAGVLSRGATVVAERERRDPLPEIPGFEQVDERRYGDTLVTRLVPQTGESASESETGSKADASESTHANAPGSD